MKSELAKRDSFVSASVGLPTSENQTLHSMSLAAKMNGPLHNISDEIA